jgi:NADH:ubiquinone oxidoreductase subunit F (NADH-binding)
LATNTLHALTPDALVERLAASGLRGRGGGWFEAARKWRAVRVEGGEPFVVANGAEGEPGSYKDRFVMLKRPQDVVAGLALAARAVGAREAVVFLKGSFDRPAKALSGAIAAASLDGLSVEVRRGDDAYVTGEETAVIEALEGRKPWPRPKPPLPAAVGFRGRPTLVQNVETLARVPAALDDPEAYRRSETALVTVWGEVRRPGVYEVPLGTPLGRVIDEHAGGTTEAIGLVFPGGPAGMPLGPTDLDVPLDPEALRAKGTALGTGAILVLGESACPLAVAASVAFGKNEGFGSLRCVRRFSIGRRIRRMRVSSSTQGRNNHSNTKPGVPGRSHGTENSYVSKTRTKPTTVASSIARPPSHRPHSMESCGAASRSADCAPIATAKPANAMKYRRVEAVAKPD